MKKNTLLHSIIGVCALVLALVAVYFIYRNHANLLSAGIIAFAGFFVALSQYMIIKNKR